MKEEKTVEPSQRQALGKAMSYFDYISLGIGSIIGVGWVIVAGDWLVRGGPLGAILAFIIGGFLITIIGLCYAELTPAIPVAGGTVAFGYKAFGSATSFLAAWFLSFGYIFICPFEAVAIGWLFEYLIPGLKSHTLYTVGTYQVSLVSIVAGVLLSLFIIALNYRGIKYAARFQTISTALMILCVIVFTLVALWKGSLSNIFPLFAREGTKWPALGSIIGVLGVVPFFMSGFDTIPQTAEESKKKANLKDLGKAVLISIISASLFYAIVALDISLCMPWKETIKLELPTATVFRVSFGYEWAAQLVLFTAFLGLITSFNGFFLAATRVLFSTGRGGLLPKKLGDISQKYQTPKNAILFVSLITLAGPFVGRSSLLPIVNVTSLALVCGWLIACLSAIRLRKIYPEMKRPYRVKSKIILYFGVMISGILILLLILPGSSAQLKWPVEYLILAVWVFLGYIGYRWRKAKKDISDEERAFQILGDYR